MGFAVLQSGENAVTAWNFCKTEFIKPNIVAAEVDAVGVGWFYHKITSILVYLK